MVPYLLESRFLRSRLHKWILFKGIVSLVRVVNFRLICKLRVKVESVQPKILVGSEAGMRGIWSGVEDCSIVYLLRRKIVHCDS